MAQSFNFFRRRQTWPALGLLALMSLGTGSSAAQSSNWCGKAYDIRRGDTLSELSASVYGRADAFLRFYEDPRNEQALGGNPNRIAVGTRIHLPPCDGAAAGGAGELSAQVQKRPPSGAASAFVPIEIVTGTDYAPFTDEKLPDGGMLVKVVEAAFGLSSLSNPVSIDFINDWGSHLDTLLPKGKYAFGFPWFQPDCANIAVLSEAMRARCDLTWSDPLFTVPIGFYYDADHNAEPALDFTAMRGTRVCRPEGYFTFDLEQRGLTADVIGLTQPAAVDDCFRMLAEGEVDYVSINRFLAEKAIARTGLSGRVKPLQTIVTTQKLHLVAHRYDTRAGYDWMPAFNEGLRRLKASGDFTRITRVYLQLHDQDVRALASGGR